MSKMKSMRRSPQAIHPFPQGSDDVQGCRVDLEFRGSQVVCVRRGHGREEEEASSLHSKGLIHGGPIDAWTH